MERLFIVTSKDLKTGKYFIMSSLEEQDQFMVNQEMANKMISTSEFCAKRDGESWKYKVFEVDY